MKRLIISASLLSLVACSGPIETIRTDGQTAHIRLSAELTTGTDTACDRAVYEAQRYMQRTGSTRIIAINSGYAPFKEATAETLKGMED